MILCDPIVTSAGQYWPTAAGETIPTREIDFAFMSDSWILVNVTEIKQKQFAWSLAGSFEPVRFETWNDSMGNIAGRNFGRIYDATLTRDVPRVRSIVEEFSS